MNKHAERFSKLPWEEVSDVARQKLIDNGEKRIRLLELRAGFREQEWCRRGHTGYIIGGSLNIEFEDHQQVFDQGEPLLISAGEPHKASVKDGKVVLFLVDEL